MSRKQRLRLLALGLGVLLSACFNNGGSAPEPGADNNNVARLQRVFPQLAFTLPVAMLQAPASDERWYVVEKAGRVLTFANDNATGQSAIFADITARVDDGPNEAGLLGMAFHPDFANNGQVFLSYTRSGSGNTPLVSVISRFTAQAGGQSLDTASEQVILSVDQPYTNHNGGHIAFGPDGFLYIGLGDGGSGGDPQGHGQNTASLLGSILRIDVNGTAPYAIPAGNPFANGVNGRPEIYAWGLRNPWRWNFDLDTGELWAGDVGQNQWEEINIIQSGGNYGWNIREGRHCYASGSCSTAGLIEPVFEYSHSEGCSVTGGYVYRGASLPQWNGVYLLGDFCSGRIWGLFPDNGAWEGRLLFSSDLRISSFAQVDNGEVYALDYATGGIYQFMPVAQ